MAAFSPMFPDAKVIDKNLVAIVDGDMDSYYSSISLDDQPNSNIARNNVKKRMERIIYDTGAGTLEVHLSGKTNFRFGIATWNRYKCKRYEEDGTRILPQPKYLNACRSTLIKQFSALVSKNCEADDTISISAREHKLAGRDVIICSGDKDLRINEGSHYCTRRAITEEVTKCGYIKPVFDEGTLKLKKVEGAGLMFFFYQMLVGDSCDDIPGLPKIGEGTKSRWPKVRRGGVGDTKAIEILRTVEDEYEAFKRVVFCYWDYFNTFGTYNHCTTGRRMHGYLDYLVEQMRLLWMQQYNGQMVTPSELFDDKDIIKRILKEIAYGQL